LENERASLGPSAFGSLLRRYRLAAGFSQEALAERARISAQGIGALERGDRRTPQRETLNLLAKALGLDAEQRLEFEAAAVRQSTPRPGRTPVATGPWPIAAPRTLPLSLTATIGRTAETDAIGHLVREHRLVTVTGLGGIGKTRMALDVGAAVGSELGEATFVELAPVSDARFVAEAIATALGLQHVPNRTLLETLAAFLVNEKRLLILDNCEHVVAEVARLVETLLQRSETLRVLATSREPLRVRGERVYRLPPLDVPANDASAPPRAVEVAAFSSVALFVQRAQAVDHTFVLTDENAPYVAEICARLEGIPLAIELAGARVGSLSLPALAERLSRRFLVLGGGDRTAPDRRQTMRATIDWSYELLGERERTVFERFSIFSGGCTLEAASIVCAEEGDPEQDDVFETLSSLVDKSLIVADINGSATRYRMLETFRQYAREKVVARGEQRLLSERHAVAYLGIAEELEREIFALPDTAWRARARAELDNWRAALEWSLAEGGNVLVGQRLAASLKQTWGEAAISDGRRWICLAIDRIDDDTPSLLVAKLDQVYAELCEQYGEYGEALVAAKRAIARYRELGDDLGTALAQASAVGALVRLGRPEEAEEPSRQALETARKHERHAFAARVLNLIAEASALRGDFTAARAASAEALGYVRGLGKMRSVAVALATLAELEFRAGDVDAALRNGAEALRIGVQHDHSGVIAASVRANMAAYLVVRGRYDEAREQACESLAISRRMQFPLQAGWALQHLAAILVLQSQAGPKAMATITRAARVAGFVEARYAELGTDLEPTDKQENERLHAALRASLPAADLEFALTAGATMSEEEAIEEALGL